MILMITKKVVGTEKSGVNVWFLAARSLLSQSIAVIMMMMTRRRMMTMITRRMTMKSMMILLMTLLLQLLLLLLIRLGSSEFSRPVFPRNQPILINSTVIADFLSKVLIVLIVLYFLKKDFLLKVQCIICCQLITMVGNTFLHIF